MSYDDDDDDDDNSQGASSLLSYLTRSLLESTDWRSLESLLPVRTRREQLVSGTNIASTKRSQHEIRCAKLPFLTATAAATKTHTRENQLEPSRTLPDSTIAH